MASVRVAFGGLKVAKAEDMKERKEKQGFKNVRTKMIFQFNMDGKFISKAILVESSHKKEPPLYTTYSSVVTKKSVRVAFLCAGMNDLDISACYIENEYLNTPCQEKLWTKAGS